MAVADVLVSFLLLVSIYAILAFGMNVKYGHTGLLDFGHVAFFLVGAYTATIFVLPPDEPGDFTEYVVGFGDLPLVGTWVGGLVVATVLAGVIGGLVALPTIRLREDYLAITVLGVSVIFQRIIQAETWLANGPDALRGYSPPLQSLFPLDLSSVVGALPVGIVVFVAWAGATISLAVQLDRESRLPLGRVYGAATVGLGRVGPLRDAGHAVVATLAALVAALVSMALLVTGERILVVGLVVSLYGWFVGIVALGGYYRRLTWREAAVGVGLGTGLLVALLPLPVADALVIKIGGTLVLLAALVAAYAYGVRNLQWVNDAKLTVIGVGVLWFVGIWYFLLPVLGPLGSGDVGGVVGTLFANVVWTLRFGGNVGIDYAIALVGGVTVRLDYSRLLLALFLLSMGVLYHALQVTVRSPFGRVLRAVRNDEEVVKSIGKNPFVYKVQSMVIGSALAGFAGGLFAMYSQGLTFTSFAPRVTFITLLIMFVGGVGNNRGMIFGAVVFWAFQQATTQIASFFPTELRVNVLAFRLVIIGVLFLVVLYYLPDGVLGREEATSEVTEE